MKFEYRYDVPRDDARIRLEALGEYLKNRHGIRVSWGEDDKARFSGKYLVVNIDGELTLGDGIVNFNGKDPGVLWRKRAMKYLQDKLAAYLDPNTPVEDLPRDKT
jgi:hypothetical protein